MQLTKYRPKNITVRQHFILFYFYFELIRQVDDIVLCFLVWSWKPVVSRTLVEKQY